MLKKDEVIEGKADTPEKTDIQDKCVSTKSYEVLASLAVKTRIVRIDFISVSLVISTATDGHKSAAFMFLRVPVM